VTVSVYFVQAGDGPVKIGFSADVAKRIGELQTGNPERLRLVCEQTFDSEAGARTYEAAYHSMFEEERIGSSEWFRPHPDIFDLCAKLTEMAKLRGPFTLLFNIVRRGEGGIELRPR
jgi:hypothetical protein